MRGESRGLVKVLTWHLFAKAGWLKVTERGGERWRRVRLGATCEEGDEVDGRPLG
jgi:hypothetical protein